MQAAAFAAILAIAAVAVPMLTAGKVGLQEASAQASVAAGSTIKVTGDASMSITPDQVMFSVSRQSQPQPDAIQALAEQEEYIAQITEAVTAISEDTTVTVGQKYLNPFYSGPGQYPSDVTFSIYSTIAVHTSVDSLSPLVSKLVEEGYGFESVYLDPIYSARLLEASGVMQPDGTLPPETESEQKPLIIGVNLSTQPAKLKETLDEYVGKYKKLVGILKEAGISESDIQQTNFYVNPQYYGGYPQYSSYQTYTQILVKTNAESLESVKNAIQAAGGNIDNITTTISDAQIEEARKELTQNAISNAESRASEIAESLGAHVRSIKSIEIVGQSGYNPYYGSYPIYYRGVNFMQSPGFYNPGFTDVSVSAVVEFEISR